MQQVFSFDIFCKVVDNYGDIGICFRLAQQLANEKQQNVRLWVDDLTVFNKLCPQIDPAKNTQTVKQITVCKWHDDLPNNIKLNRVVIEAFACNLPNIIVQNISKHNLWLNLEYLTCEKWVTTWHGLPSMQNNNLRKYVYFPSLQENAGGVLYAADLKDRLANFQYDFQHPFKHHSKKHSKNNFLKNRFLATLNIKVNPNSQLISLFCYEHAYLNAWFELLSKQQNPTTILVQAWQIVPKINAFLGKKLTLNKPLTIGNLTFLLIEFVAQEDFDYLLAVCDFNIVRGEDSFIRAIFAGRPFLWHIYPQAENAHLPKLQAFLDLYLQNYAHSAQIAKLFLQFNQGNNINDLWQKLDFNSWHLHAKNFANYQFAQPDLASLLMQFVAQRL